MAGLDEQLASIRTIELRIEAAQKELDEMPAKAKALREHIAAQKKAKADLVKSLRDELPEGVVRKRKAATQA